MTMTDEGTTAEHAAVEHLVDAGLLDVLMSRVDAGEVQLSGEGGGVHLYCRGGSRCAGIVDRWSYPHTCFTIGVED